MARNDGGPAFPRPGHFHPEADADFDSRPQDGLSLRDYFAAAALTAIVSDAETCPATKEATGKMAYAFADAMLAARDAKE